VVMPMYFGYAALFGLQHDVKVRVGIKDDDSDASDEFGFAISCLFIFNLYFRLLHGIVFARLSCRGRVVASMGCMVAAMLALVKPRMSSGPQGVRWVMLTYALGGVAIGTFEPNFLSCIAPLGVHTKKTAILGIPSGISCLLILGFFVMGPPLRVPVEALYAAAACALFCGMGVVWRLPAPSLDGAIPAGLHKLTSDARQFRRWLPQTWSYMLVFVFDMFTVAAFSPGVALYIYNAASVVVGEGFVVATNSFFAAFNTFSMLGSLLGRWLSYKVKPRHPAVYAIFNLAGMAFMLLRVPLLVPLSAFLTMLGDGLIYGSTTRHIDAHVPGEFNLVATSCWCLLGDVGAIIGTNLIIFFRDIASLDR